MHNFRYYHFKIYVNAKYPAKDNICCRVGIYTNVGYIAGKIDANKTRITSYHSNMCIDALYDKKYKHELIIILWQYNGNEFVKKDKIIKFN